MIKKNKLACSVFVFLVANLTASAFPKESKLYSVWDASLESNQKSESDGWKVTQTNGSVLYTFVMDGGSSGISFRSGNESITLFHDRSFLVTTIKGTDGFPDVQLTKERKDGLLYLGLENLGKGIPADVNSPLFLELEQQMKEYVESHDLLEGKEMSAFLDTVERMRSNKAVDTTAANARLFHNETSKSNNPDVEAMTEAAVVSP